MEEVQILKADGSEYVPELDDDCPHKNTQVVGGLGRTPERTICVDCKKEL